MAFVPGIPEPQSFELPGVADLVAAIVGDLVALPRAEVLQVDAEHALAGLRSQVLQTQCGSRKGTVKTGAADQVILESARDLAAVNAEPVILGTGDRRLQTTCGRQAPAVSVASSRRECFELLASQEEIEQGKPVHDVIDRYFRQMLLDGSVDLVSAARAEQASVWDRNDHGSGRLGDVVTTEIGPAEEVSIRRLRAIEEGRVLSVDLAAVAEVRKNYFNVFVSPDGDADYEFDFGTAHTRTISMSFVVRLDSTGRVEWSGLTSRMVVQLPGWE